MEALGAVLAAISVLVVVFARMAKWSYLRKLWICRKESIASSENVSSSCSGLSSFANMAFIVVARVCALLDVITSGFLVNIHVGGHLVKASCGRA